MDIWIGVASVLEVVIWRQTNAHTVCPNGCRYCLKDLEYNSGTVLDGATVIVCPVVDVVVEELIEKIAVRA